MSTDIDALVVGGGPVGLALGCELLRHGLRCRVIETRTERDVWSKAAGIQPRTLEVFHHMGIARQIVEMGSRIHGINVNTRGKRLARAELHFRDTPYPFMIGLSQARTEEALEEHLRSLGGKLERGIELTGFEQSGNTVTAGLKRDDGTTETLEVPWLIGCDGSRSFVRKHLGLAFEGSTFEQSLIHADLHVTFPFPVDPGEGEIFVSADGAAAFLPLFGEGQYRLILMAPPEELSEPTLENFKALVKLRAPEYDIELSEPEWMMGFRVHSRIVPSHRASRVFLAGDAAHIHSPAGAQGMNLGIQDAFNLAWKLALVERGFAADALLDSYDRERRPIGESVVNTTDAGTRRALRALTLRNPVSVAIRDQVMRFVVNSELFVDRVARGIGGFNVGYPDSPAVAQHHSSVWTANLGADRTTENPDLRSWLGFESGPGPGGRVPDADLPGSERSLIDLMAEPRHTLLLFDGAADSEAGYRNLRDIGQEVHSSYGHLIKVFAVVPHQHRPPALDWDELQLGEILFDPEFELHSHFGARTESLYLIRPDGYVGYRSQPADAGHLFEYLRSLFRRRADE